MSTSQVERAGKTDCQDAERREQQMLAIGRGLMADPKLMLIDEMSLGLAPS